MTWQLQRVVSYTLSLSIFHTYLNIYITFQTIPITYLESPIIQEGVIKSGLSVSGILGLLELHVGESTWSLRVKVARNVNVEQRPENSVKRDMRRGSS